MGRDKKTWREGGREGGGREGGGSKIVIERLSLTFTANGKNKTFAVCLQLSVQ